MRPPALQSLARHLIYVVPPALGFQALVLVLKNTVVSVLNPAHLTAYLSRYSPESRLLPLSERGRKSLHLTVEHDRF